MDQRCSARRAKACEGSESYVRRCLPCDGADARCQAREHRSAANLSTCPGCRREALVRSRTVHAQRLGRGVGIRASLASVRPLTLFVGSNTRPLRRRLVLLHEKPALRLDGLHAIRITQGHAKAPAQLRLFQHTRLANLHATGSRRCAAVERHSGTRAAYNRDTLRQYEDEALQARNRPAAADIATVRHRDVGNRGVDELRWRLGLSQNGYKRHPPCFKHWGPCKVDRTQANGNEANTRKWVDETKHDADFRMCIPAGKLALFRDTLRKNNTPNTRKVEK